MNFAMRNIPSRLIGPMFGPARSARKLQGANYGRSYGPGHAEGYLSRGLEVGVAIPKRGLVRPKREAVHLPGAQPAFHIGQIARRYRNANQISPKHDFFRGHHA